MATASHALYGVDVYSDSSEDSGNWESAGPRRSGGYRVEVSAGNATEKDRDAASDSDSDSEDDAMLVALVSAIACRADQPPVFDPRDPIRTDDFVFDSAATADEWGVLEDDDAWEDDDEECSASSLSASSEDLEGLEDLVEISRTRNAARRVTRPAPRFRQRGDSPNKSAKNINIDAFAATRPSAVGGRWGPPPKKNARASERTKPVKEKEQEPFAGPIPTVRAAVARAMAGALERETAKAERALFSRSPDDSPRLLGTKTQSRRRVRTDSLIAAVADLSSRAEWAHEQAIGYELEGARSRSKYASPEKAEHFSSRRRRAPSSAFAKAPRTSLFAEIASAAAKRDGAGRLENDVSKTRPSDSRAKAVDGSAPPEKEKEKSLEKKTTETARRKKPKLDAVSSRARAPLAAKDESSSDESETDAWWTAPFGGVSFAAKKKTKTKTRARTASENEPGLVGLDAMRVAMDRTRPRPSGARGVTKWVKPKPFVSRASPGMEDSFASASSGASGDSAAWWDGRGHRVAKALRRREKTPRTLRGPLAEKSFAPGNGDRDPTRPRVAGPFAWSPPKTSTATNARNASSSASARIKLGERFKRKSGPLRGVAAYQTIPSDAFLRRRAPCVVFRPLAARAKRKKGVSRRLAERARRRDKNAPTSLRDSEDDRSNVSVERNDERSETRGNRASERPDEDVSSPLGSTPGPGAYDVAGATSATRPSAASAPSFAPRSRPAEIRVGSRRDFVHTPDEVPLDLSAEKWIVAAGSRVKQNFPSVSFEKAPPRETETARAFRAALARNAEPSFGEVSARRDARARIAAYEFGEALFLDPLARKIASGEIVAPPEPTFALVEASVKRTPSWGLFAFSSRGGDVFDDENEVSDFRERDARALASDPLRAWRAAVAPSVKQTPVFVKPRALDTVFEREEDEALVRGPTRAHGAADELARGRALGGGGALPLRYYLGRDEDYASRIASREREDEATKPVAYETDATGIGGAPVVASLRVAEALDALRASTPATVFGLAAERWAARERAERKHSAETKRRAEARRVSKESVAETYVAGKAARLLDEDPETEPARLARLALARDAVAARDPGSGSHAWLGIEAARAALAATRPSAPGWTMLPLEVTKPRVAAGRVVKPGDRPALDVRVSLVKTKGFLDGASAFDFARAAGRFHDAADEYSGGASSHNPRTGPAAYRTEKADALLSRRAPAATFGTAARLPREIKIADEDRTETFSASEAVSETRVSLDRLVRRRRGVGVNMRLDSNPRFDAETLRLQTEARRFRATRKLEKLVGSSATEGPETGGSARLRKSQSARDGEEFFDPTAATRARVPMADFASLTWRVSENAKGRVEMELLEAEIGPGRYDPNDEVTSSRRRAPEADFASAARRFPEEPPDMSLNAEEPPRYSRALLSRDDVAAAVKAVRPRVAVGGVIPDAGKRDIRAKNEPDAAAPLPPSAVVNLEDALRYLRGARHSSAPDFARAAPKSGDGGVLEDARSFADVSASASVAAGGAKGASRGSNVSAFGKPPKTSPKKPADWKSKDPDAFAEGDVLFLLPERALEATRASRFDAPDFAKTLGREMVAKLAPDVTLTADVDFVPEKALRARFPRLDRGTNAVDIGRPRRASSRPNDRSSERYYADLDAGVYAPRDGDDRRGVLSGQRYAGKSLVNLARAPASERGAFENVARNDGGDALVLDAAAAADGTRPRRDVGAASFARAPRRTGETRASPGGDALVLHPAAVSASDATRGFDFGRAAGRERSAFERARWGEDDVIHALRAEPPTISTLDRSLAKVHAAGVDGRTLAAARRMERRARLEARMPRRGPGSEAPRRERTDGPVR